jgi:hypothetical protein
MRVVQALYWLADLFPADQERLLGQLRAVLEDPMYGADLREDLKIGLPTLPTWMQSVVRELLK